MREESDPCTVKYFNYSSLLLFVILITIASVVYYLRMELKDMVTTGYGLVYEKDKRLDYTIAVVYNVCMLRDIYCDKTDNSGEILKDRIRHYFSAMKTDVASLFGVQQSVTRKQDKSVFEDEMALLDESESVVLKEVERWDEDGLVLGRDDQCSFDAAITKIVTRVSDILGVSEESFRSRSLTDEELFKWNRNAGYLVYNSLHTLLPMQQHATESMLDIIDRRVRKEKRTAVWLNSVMLVLSAVSLLALLPFIYKAHCGILAVLKMFIRLPKSEIQELVLDIIAYKGVMNNNLGRMIKDFYELNMGKDSGNLEVTPEALGIDSKKKEHKKSNAEEEQSEKEEEDIALKLKKVELERKVRAISAASSGSRNKFMVEVIGMTIVFGIYFAIALPLKLSYFNKIQLALNIGHTYCYTLPMVNYVLFSAMEDFSEMRETYVKYWGTDRSAYDRNLYKLLDNLQERESLEGEIERKFKQFNDMISQSNSDYLCNFATYCNCTSMKCDEAYDRVLYYGYQNVVNQVLLEIQTLYFKFLNYLETGNTDQLKNILRKRTFIEVIDLNSVFLFELSGSFFEYIIDFGNTFFSEVAKFDIWDFAIFIVLVFLVFFIALRIFLSSFKDTMLEAKRMLGIIPTKFIARDIEKIKSIISQVS
eukprot:TRINITY_DN39_c0_g2_i1.p1 TRINITY_DN39_c0_g2~~TRINITY_DN39_c0_g2_i1.p1  ORF type:complete len:722 (+),score=200.35 TRINITY_DN39_c0_g2_i1:220-2166(+)